MEEISQANASNIVRKISNLPIGMHRTFIKFPSTRERNWQMYQELSRQEDWNEITRIDGSVDCIYIKIVNTPTIS